MNVAEIAQWLRQIANDVRAAGDVPLVQLSEEGVGPSAVSLADELWLVSVQVDALMEDEWPG